MFGAVCIGFIFAAQTDPVRWLRYTNDPRNIAKEDHMAAINATLEVDFLGQCASESLGSEYWYSSDGQLDFARGSHVLGTRPALYSASHDREMGYV